MYRIKSDADLKFMITFNGIIIFFPLCAPSPNRLAAQCGEMKFVREEHYIGKD